MSCRLPSLRHEPLPRLAAVPFPLVPLRQILHLGFLNVPAFRIEHDDGWGSITTCRHPTKPQQRGCGKPGALLYCWWEYKMVWPLGKTVWPCLQELNMELPCDPAPLLPGRYPKRMENKVSNKNLYRNVLSSTIRNSQKVGTNQISTDRQINKMNKIT